MKLKVTTLALFAAGLLAGLTLIAPATGADPPTTTSGSTTSGTTTTVATTTTTPTTTTTSTEHPTTTTTTTPTTTTTHTTTTTATTTTTPSYSGAQDPISALSSTSITVGPLTCSIGSSSPSVSFKVGDRVKIYCLNGSLSYIFAGEPLPKPASTTTTTYPDLVTRGGTLTAIGEHTITVDGLTCAVSPTSQSVSGLKVGDRVFVYCSAAVLIKFFPLTDSHTEPTTVTRSGTIGGLSSSSITVGELTCSLNSSSPSLAGFKVGDQVGVACTSGALVKIAAAYNTEHHDDLTTRMGTITALSSAGITVDGLTCTFGPSSPSPTAFKVGDLAGIGCYNGVLVKIGRPYGDDHHDSLTTRLGEIAALSSTSITVDGLTCSVGAGSPSVAAFKVGDQVGIGCANGVLVKIGKLQTDDQGFKVGVQLGPIAALSADSITVGPLTCKLATSSPAVGAYKVGDRVGIGCAGGILFMIGTLPNSVDTPKTEIKRALLQRFHACIKRGSEHCTVKGILRKLPHK
jgi:hypothetical protein